MIGRLIKLLAVVVVLIGIGLTIYAYVGDLAPGASDQSLTVTLDAD